MSMDFQDWSVCVHNKTSVYIGQDICVETMYVRVKINITLETFPPLFCCTSLYSKQLPEIELLCI